MTRQSLNSRLHQLHTEAEEAKAIKAVETAGPFDSGEDVCVACGKKMVAVIGSKNLPMWACFDDRVAVPRRSDEKIVPSQFE